VFDDALVQGDLPCRGGSLEEVTGTRVAGAGEDEDTAARTRQHGSDAVAAQQRVDCHGVGPEHVEERSSVRGHGAGDVAALAVEDEQAISRNC
jgi:hypothetical protein